MTSTPNRAMYRPLTPDQQTAWAEDVRERMNTHGITTTRLALATPMAADALRHILAGHRAATPLVLMRVSALLGLEAPGSTREGVALADLQACPPFAQGRGAVPAPTRNRAPGTPGGEFSRLVAGRLDRLGLTRRDLAAAVPCSDAALSLVLAGRRPWRPLMVLRVAHLVGVPAGEVPGVDEVSGRALSVVAGVDSLIRG